ncbi:protein TRC8 homolog [Mytilus californianus]|uniref:protein TRC8 homolog n=1 Tax=Mytilus californianus TaxID=6549 RepID=UPI0022476DBF|nr:protein TRC8 homolog [Mytilus californianus]
MSYFRQFKHFSNVLIRIPPLFIIDSLLNGSLLKVVYQSVHPEYSLYPITTWTQLFQWLATSFTILVLAVMLFVAARNHLIELYNYVLVGVILMVSYHWNLNFVVTIYKEEVEQNEPYHKDLYDILQSDFNGIMKNIIIQICVAVAFLTAWEFRQTSLRRSYVYLEGDILNTLLKSAVSFSMIFPIIVRAIYQDFIVLLWSPVLSMIIPLAILVKHIMDSLSTLRRFTTRIVLLTKMKIHNLGIQTFLEEQWIRLQVPRVLRMFWILRLTVQVSLLYSRISQDDFDELDQENLGKFFLKKLLADSCDTFVSLLGLTSIISYIAHYIGLFMAFCVGSNTEEDRSMGTVSAILFFILALQTGLTGLDPDSRLIRLAKNTCLLFTAMAHFVHSMIHPVLMSLSASKNQNVISHVRVLSMCLFLIVFPIVLLIYLWSHYTANTWLLAVTAFSIEVMMKVFFSLLTYILFMVDAYMDVFWEKLDDYVYYIKATGNTMEFMFGIFLFCNGGWIIIFESGGIVRAVMMCIHAYFNIWCQAKEGWKVFMKRRTAVHKINSLPEATEEQLEELDDVCAICYQSLTSARITHCNHYFHNVCLRKWLYVQDNCPLCHKLIYQPVVSTLAKTDSSQNIEQQAQNPQLQEHLRQELEEQQVLNLGRDGAAEQ